MVQQQHRHPQLLPQFVQRVQHPPHLLAAGRIHATHRQQTAEHIDHHQAHAGPAIQEGPQHLHIGLGGGPGGLSAILGFHAAQHVDPARIATAGQQMRQDARTLIIFPRQK